MIDIWCIVIIIIITDIAWKIIQEFANTIVAESIKEVSFVYNSRK